MNSERIVNEVGMERTKGVVQKCDNHHKVENLNSQSETEYCDETYEQKLGQNQRQPIEGRQKFWKGVKRGWLKRTAPIVNKLVPQRWRMTRTQRSLVSDCLANNIEVNIIDRETKYVPIVQVIFDDFEEGSDESLTSFGLEDDQNMDIITPLVELQTSSMVAVNMISEETEVRPIEFETESTSSGQGVSHSSGYQTDRESVLNSDVTPNGAEQQNQEDDRTNTVTEEEVTDAMVAAINFWHLEADRQTNMTPIEIPESHSLAAGDWIFHRGKQMADVLTDSLSHISDEDSLESSCGRAMAQLFCDRLMDESVFVKDYEKSDEHLNRGLSEELSEELCDTVSIVSIDSENSWIESTQSDAIGFMSESHMSQSSSGSILSLYSDDSEIESSHSEGIGYWSDNYLDQFYEDISTSIISIDSGETYIESTQSDGIKYLSNSYSDDSSDQYSVSVLSKESINESKNVYDSDKEDAEDCEVTILSIQFSDESKVCHSLSETENIEGSDKEVTAEETDNQCSYRGRDQMVMNLESLENWINSIDVIQVIQDFRLSESNQTNDEFSIYQEVSSAVTDSAKMILVFLFFIQLLSFIC